MASSSNYQAWVEVVPEFKGFNKSVVKGVSDSLGRAGDEGGRTFGDRLAGAVGAIAKPLAIVGGAALSGVGLAAGVALSKGLSRSLNIQDAQAKLRGLGNDAETITEVMKNSLESVKGTAFGLDEAATTAASAIASGIKPGQELTRYLKITADTAAIAGSSLSDIGSVMNNVTTVGAAYNDSLQILAQKGIPIYQYLADQLGITTDEVKNLASEGKISAEDFRTAIENNVAGAALAGGETARGALANLGAALGRFGAKFTDPLVAAAPGFFGTLATAVDSLGEKAQPFADQFAKWVGPAIENAGTSIANFINGDPGKLADFFGGIGDAVEKFSPYLPALASGFADFGGNVASILGPAITDNLPGLQDLAQTLLDTATDVLPELLPALGDLVLAILPILPAITPLITDALPPLIDLLGQLLEPTGDSSGLDAVVGAVGGLADALGFLLGLLPGPLVLIPQLVEAFKTTEGAANFVEQAMSGKLGPVIQAIGGFIQGLAGFFRDSISNIRSTVASGVDNIKASFDRVFSALPAPVRSALSTVGSVISGGISGAVSTIATLGPRAVSALGNTGSLLVGAGRNLVDGFIAGMVGGIGRVAARAAELANAARTAAERALDINSPSRVFRDEIGMMVGLGMAEGIDRSAAQVKQSMADLAGVPDMASRSYAFDASVAGSSVGGNTYVQNPFTGEYLLAKQEQIAGQAVAAYDATSSMSDRMGRQRAGR